MSPAITPSLTAVRPAWGVLLPVLLLAALVLPAAEAAVSSGSGISFDPDGNGASDAVLSSSRRLGLGTLVPGGNLHVRGNVLLADGTAAAGRVLASNSRGGGAWTDPAILDYATAWTSASGNLYYSGGKIGIGTASPSTNLHLSGNLFLPGANAALDRALACDAGGLASWVTLPVFATNWTWDGNTSCYASGNAGIGTASPEPALEIASGNAMTSGNLAAFRRGTRPTKVEAFNTWTSATSWESGALNWRASANVLYLGTEKGSGGGSARNFRFVHGSSSNPAGGYRSSEWAGIGIASANPDGNRAAWVGTNANASYYNTCLGYGTYAGAGVFNTAIGAYARTSSGGYPYGRTSLSSGLGPVSATTLMSGLQPLVISTTDATPTKMVQPNTGGAGEYLAAVLANDSSVAVSGVAMAVSQDNTQTATFRIFAVFQNNAGTTTMVGSSITQVSNNGNAWSLSASGNNTTDRWDLTVTGSATPIMWSALLVVAEATY